MIDYINSDLLRGEGVPGHLQHIVVAFKPAYEAINSFGPSSAKCAAIARLRSALVSALRCGELELAVAGEMNDRDEAARRAAKKEKRNAEHQG